MAENLSSERSQDNVSALNPDANGCCDEGITAHIDLKRAAQVKGQLGFEHVTAESIAYLERRCVAVDECHLAMTGVCALEAAGIKKIP
jgi:hypothetical protein